MSYLANRLGEIARMGEAATGMQAGSLSEPESALVTTPAVEGAASREDLELRLYYHLDCARRARVDMENARDWDGGYVNRHRDREVALQRAGLAYRQLSDMVDMRGVPDDLAAMAIAEGLST